MSYEYLVNQYKLIIQDFILGHISFDIMLLECKKISDLVCAMYGFNEADSLRQIAVNMGVVK